MTVTTVDIRHHVSRPTVERLVHLADDLRSSLTMRSIVHLDLSDDDEPDIRIIQTVESARRHAHTVGADLSLSTPVDARLAGLLQRAGFSAGEHSFWFQGNCSA